MTGASTSPDLRLFIPLTKVDIEKRLVYGVATAEEPDLSGEVCDYATTKPLYEAWSDGVKKASGGKSLGNLRAMHGPTAAGKLMDISFDDAARKIEICAKVVDDNEWKKVQEGVYTGFSQGGRYVKRWDDEKTGFTKYTADPSEVSLVDLPCLPTATFNVIKGEGMVEKRAFTTVVEEPDTDAIKTEAEALAKTANDGRAWREFAEAATTKLMKAQVGAALAKLDIGDKADDKQQAETKKADEDQKVEKAAEKGAEKSDKRFEPEQLWSCGCAEHKHITKAEAVKCMKKRAADEATAAVSAPVNSALAKLEAELGIAKDDQVEKAKKDAGGDKASTAHREAADAHEAAAELHESMAAHDSTNADEAEDHLNAAQSHRRAAAAHARAADLHDKNDEGADDASKKSGLMTRNAADKSDAMFAQKCVKSGALAKYSPDEGRANDGRWTSGAGEHAKKEAQSVTGALAATAFAMGVGEVAAKAGSKVGEKVGRYAGKAIALAASKGNVAAGEGGAAVGGKVGSIAGNIAGRMYGEARGWSLAASKSASGGALKKDLYSVSRLADLLQSLSWLQNSVADEAIRENDGSPIPGALKEQIKALANSLVEMAREETSELFGGSSEGAYAPAEVLAMAAGLSEGQRDALIKISVDVPALKSVAGVLEKTQGEAINRTLDRFVTEMQTLVKIGARNSAADMDRLQKAHDLLSELGADCAKADGTDEGNEEVEKFRNENASLRKTVDDLGTRLAIITEKVAELGKRAAPAKAALRAVEKGDDVDSAGAAARGKTSEAELAKQLAAMSDEERAKLLMKVALANPVSVIQR